MKINCAAILFCLPILILADAPTATVEDGVLTGTTTLIAGATAPVNQFLGVPFAKSPPVRFGMPEPVEKYTSKVVNKWTNSCMQQFPR
jgi:carboxylesterase type B